MRFERIFLAPEWPDAWLDVYTNDRPIAQDGVLVIPGGGYSDVCVNPVTGTAFVVYESEKETLIRVAEVALD